MDSFLEISVDASGPVFDGIARAEARRYAHDLETQLGDDGVAMIRAYLPTQYMYLGHHGGTPRYNPVPANAGFLESQIHTERQTEDSLIVTDTPVTYGAWIEGVDPSNWIIYHQHRNPPARRFPGYHTFRVITQKLDSEAEGRALGMLPPYLDAMNG